MNTLLSAQSISYSVTSGLLFEGISFTLKKGDRIGLIGNNGSGKSTLLKLLTNDLSNYTGVISLSHQCQMARVEQQLPAELQSVSMLEALVARLPSHLQHSETWQAEVLLSNIGFDEQYWNQPINTLSGGLHARLLIARALILNPDTLLLDEPSNHLDLPTLLWLEDFLTQWKGTFILVSHDQRLLDRVTNCTWILRDKKLHFFQLGCSEARSALAEKDEADLIRYNTEQKEIQRIEKSAGRLAIWGRDFDNESFARKAKSMEKRVDSLRASQTQLSETEPWKLRLYGEAMQADRLLALNRVNVSPEPAAEALFQILSQQVKSGDRVAVMGKNGTGKSSLLRMLWENYRSVESDNYSLDQSYFHPQARVGYFDQGLQQLHNNDSIFDAIYSFFPQFQETRKRALISAGFPYVRHTQRVKELSGGERSRLLFVGLSLAKYHLLMLDEPTNHLDIEGKDELAESLKTFNGGLVLVSHDRELIEKSCNRFWYISGEHLEEMPNMDRVHEAMMEEYSKTFAANASEGDIVNDSSPYSADISSDAQEILLERLIELEILLSDDLSRKRKHQKLVTQNLWQSEITDIKEKLEID